MLISGRTLITITLVIVFYTAFKGTYYFLANRLQELGLLLTFILFGYSALVASFNVNYKNLNWSFWFFLTFLFVGYTFVLPAYQFSSNANVSMIPSMMASREFLIVFISPTLYFLWRIGFKVNDLNKIITFVFATLVFTYIFHYFRIDLVAAYNSSDPTIRGMTTHDPGRGYRLKAPQVALFMTTIISAYYIFKIKSIKWKCFWIITFIACIYSWMLLQARAPTAMMIIGVIIYHVWFARKNRIGLLLLSLPILIPLYSLAIEQYFSLMASADGGVRYKSYMIAIDSILEHPLFGFGQQSAATKTEAQIFWYKFFSSDLGIIGVAFKYGITGAFLYLFLVFYILVRLVKTNWLIIDKTGECNIFLMASIAKVSTDIFNSLLGVPYAYIEGIAHAAIIIALTKIYRQIYN